MKIWKYELAITNRQTIQMQENCAVLSAQFQQGQLCVWAKVDEKAPAAPRTFAVYGTGHPMSNEMQGYIGTVQVQGGSLVFHVFEIFA